MFYLNIPKSMSQKTTCTLATCHLALHVLLRTSNAQAEFVGAPPVSVCADDSMTVDQERLDWRQGCNPHAAGGHRPFSCRESQQVFFYSYLSQRIRARGQNGELSCQQAGRSANWYVLRSAALVAGLGLSPHSLGLGWFGGQHRSI